METYNDLIVRTSVTLGVDRMLEIIQERSGRDDSQVEWEVIEETGDLVVFHALAGSSGWDIAQGAAQDLVEQGAAGVWGYLTHDEDPEALFFELTPESQFEFVASTAYLDGFFEDDEHFEDDDNPTAESGVISRSNFDPLNDQHLAAEHRDRVGENAYCWACLDRWSRAWNAGKPSLGRFDTYRELVEDIVGPRP